MLDIQFPSVDTVRARVATLEAANVDSLSDLWTMARSTVTPEFFNASLALYVARRDAGTDHAPGCKRPASKVTVPGTSNVLLSTTGKMPCRSWSIPAFKSCPGAVVAPSADGRPAVCAGCYAAKGSYVWRPVKECQTARYAWSVRCMKTPAGRAEFVATMVRAIRRTRSEFFRIHDSGDLFSPVYTDCWTEIARQLPAKRFWAPTRMYRFAAHSPVWRTALEALAALPNVALRPSALHVGDMPPVIPGFAAGTTVHKPGQLPAGAMECMAYTRKNACGPCRACWSKEVPVSYKIH